MVLGNDSAAIRHLSGEHLRAWVERPALALVVSNTRHTGTEG
ncbi:hypothetical protein C8R32_10325 [Nitrosospira sp. Nsp5]|uniref:Uncharacterized protein n=1 Tax=Nitrosospira multiformis TaxID=1231 RepID=A0ABY0T643_9PROT|nr:MULTISPECIES: hypothetical protein [Nitrosospira]PTR09409.1 hypothetical protein C8R32_10325 [Nitrosospira sp. Nsp5]SDQ30545.1 hypothetical protein SAMN05216402_0287 [Nitrosospira multiformis]